MCFSWINARWQAAVTLASKALKIVHTFAKVGPLGIEVFKTSKKFYHKVSCTDEEKANFAFKATDAVYILIEDAVQIFHDNNLEGYNLELHQTSANYILRSIHWIFSASQRDQKARRYLKRDQDGQPIDEGALFRAVIEEESPGLFQRRFFPADKIDLRRKGDGTGQAEDARHVDNPNNFVPPPVTAEKVIRDQILPIVQKRLENFLEHQLLPTIETYVDASVQKKFQQLTKRQIEQDATEVDQQRSQEGVVGAESTVGIEFHDAVNLHGPESSDDSELSDIISHLNRMIFQVNKEFSEVHVQAPRYQMEMDQVVIAFSDFNAAVSRVKKLLPKGISEANEGASPGGNRRDI